LSAKQVVINYRPHPAQAVVHRSNARFRVVRAGVRWGKTKLAVHECFWFLGKPGAKIWWLGPSWSEVLVAWRMFLEDIPRDLIRDINRTEHMVEMINHSMIWFKSAEEFEHLRAQGLDFVVLDEAARIKRDAWFECIRPRLSDPDKIGKALFVSTPKGLNWFYEIYMLGRIEGNNWESFHFPSWTNPFIRKEEIEEARREMPERLFRQEYGAEFLADLGSIFRFRRDENNKIINVQGEFQPPDPKGRYVAGADFGKRVSFTAVVVIDARTGHLVAFDRFKEVDWVLQVQRIANLVREYNAPLYVDSTGLGDPIFDFLQRIYPNVFPLHLSASRKKNLIDNLALMIEHGDLTWPDEPLILDELQVFGIEQSRSGKRKYEAPRGFYDDIVIAFALAAWGLRRGARRPGYAFLEW